MYNKVVIRLNEERGIPPEKDILEYLFLLYLMGNYKESALKGYIRVPIDGLESHTFAVPYFPDKEYRWEGLPVSTCSGIYLE